MNGYKSKKTKVNKLFTQALASQGLSCSPKVHKFTDEMTWTQQLESNFDTKEEIFKTKKNLERLEELKNQLIWLDRDRIKKRMDLKETTFDEKDWLKYQNKLQTIVVEFMVKKFKNRSSTNTMEDSKLSFLRQQYRIIDELRVKLDSLKIRDTLTEDAKEQRIEQTKDFIDSLYESKVFKQLLCAAQLRIASENNHSARSYHSTFNKTELWKKKAKLEKELELIKTLLN